MDSSMGVCGGHLWVYGLALHHVGPGIKLRVSVLAAGTLPAEPSSLWLEKQITSKRAQASRDDLKCLPCLFPLNPMLLLE